MNHNDARDQNHAADPESSQGRFHRLGMGLCFGGALMLVMVGTLSLLLTCCRPTREHVGLPPDFASPSLYGALSVRVRLMEDARQVAVTTFSPFEWTSTESGWSRRDYAGRHEVVAAGGGLVIDGQSVPHRTVVARTPQNLFELNDQPFRGSLILSVGEDGNLVATEELPLEDYVRGVVPSEMPARWPQQALKAQAVAARTFALHRTLGSTGRTWISRLDLAYRGVDGESWRSDRAVRDTLGTVLEWAGRPLPAFFHSTCGGHTASAQGVFGGLDIPPLAGVQCRWGEDSPHYHWTTTMARRELVRKLRPRGITRIRSIRTGELDSSGRVKHVIVNGNKRIPAGSFRMEVGARRIKSTAFSIRPTGDELEFSGKGWGHGVGLCQWGAHGMAERGRTWRQILHHYYPGAKLLPINELNQIR